MAAVLQDIQLAVFVALAAVAAYQWWRFRSEAAGWLTATLGILAYVVVAGRLLPESPVTDIAALLRRVNVAVLVLFPFTLYRFMRTFLPATRFLPAIAWATTALSVVGAFVVDLPVEDGPRGPMVQAYVALIVVHWTVLSGAAAGRLWRAGRGQPAVARTRMRFLGAGAIALNLALLITAYAGDEASWVEGLTAVLALASAGGFYLGFAPPSPLRALWRRRAERVVREVQLRLVAAAGTDDVGHALYPFVDRVLGGRGLVLLDTDGQVIAAHGVTETRASEIGQRVEDGETSSSDVLVAGMRSGTLVVEANPFTPFFGKDEVVLLEGLAASVDLALQRAQIAEREREVRDELVRTNAELEALVFGISHDLKSPIITLRGFVDLLRSGYGESLDDEGRHYLTRMSVSAVYMQDLLNDLLELSRIGRLQTEVEAVDLSRLASDIGEHVSAQHPHLRVEVGSLPTVRMSPGRSRQLFTNLIENAVKHAGREGTVTVRFDAVHHPDHGTVELLVRDDGKGIPREYHEKVFGIFERLEDGGVSARGTGIGLAICRKIVEEVGGTIQLVDVPVGTTFRITLPASVLATSGATPDHFQEARR